MKAGFPRILKSAYRKEPVYSLLLTMGLVDALIGGADARWGLLALGVGTVSTVTILWWWKAQQRPLPEPIESRPQRYLTAAPDPQLPNLSRAKRPGS